MIKMSMSEYQWQDTDHDKLLECIKWCGNRLQLRDWSIDLDTGSNMPKSIEQKPDENKENFDGLADIEHNKLKALLWIPLIRLQDDNKNAIETTVHELVHIMLEARGMSGDDEDREERLVKTISPFVYRDYCREHKIKIAREK